MNNLEKKECIYKKKDNFEFFILRYSSLSKNLKQFFNFFPKKNQNFVFLNAIYVFIFLENDFEFYDELDFFQNDSQSNFNQNMKNFFFRKKYNKNYLMKNLF